VAGASLSGVLAAFPGAIPATMLKLAGVELFCGGSARGALQPRVRVVVQATPTTAYGSPKRKPNGYSTWCDGGGLVIVTGSAPVG
jgi:hypothetical protein